MYAKYSQIVNVKGISENTDKNGYKYKQHHHVRLDLEFKLDCKTWLEFLTGDLKTVVSKPMIDLVSKPENAANIGFYSDTSVAAMLGFGVVFGNHWLCRNWDVQFIIVQDPSIEFLELYALCIGIFAWENYPHMTNNRICVNCDNMAVVHMVNNLTSRCKNCMFLIRMLVLNGLKFNRRITARYINTKDNNLSDALSRNQMT